MKLICGILLLAVAVKAQDDCDDKPSANCVCPVVTATGNQNRVKIGDAAGTGPCYSCSSLCTGDRVVADFPTCAFSAGKLSCNCATGYTGQNCLQCDTNYIKQGAQADSNACALASACAPGCDATGTSFCASDTCNCYTGYTGAKCDTCSAGYYKNAAGACVTCIGVCTAIPSFAGATASCSDATTCSCETGTVSGLTGSSCDTCPDGKYLASVTASAERPYGFQCDDCGCSATGSVDTKCNAFASCTCKTGYVGGKCDQAADNFRLDATGTAVACECLTGGSSGTDCPGGKCVCRAGYEGDRCNTCSAGYYGKGTAGAPDFTCEKCDCNGLSATCVASGASFRCDACTKGTTGDKCESCKAGFAPASLKTATDTFVPGNSCEIDCKSACNGITGATCSYNQADGVKCLTCGKDAAGADIAADDKGTCTCKDGSFLKDGACTECTSTCAPGEYLSGCAETSAGTCVACQLCPAGEGLQGCAGTNKGTCTSCVGLDVALTGCAHCDVDKKECAAQGATGKVCAQAYKAKDDADKKCSACETGYKTDETNANKCVLATDYKFTYTLEKVNPKADTGNPQSADGSSTVIYTLALTDPDGKVVDSASEEYPKIDRKSDGSVIFTQDKNKLTAKLSCTGEKTCNSQTITLTYASASGRLTVLSEKIQPELLIGNPSFSNCPASATVQVGTLKTKTVDGEVKVVASYSIFVSPATVDDANALDFTASTIKIGSADAKAASLASPTSTEQLQYATSNTISSFIITDAVLEVNLGTEFVISVVDKAKKTAECKFTITVEDNEPGILQCDTYSNVARNNVPGQAYACNKLPACSCTKPSGLSCNVVDAANLKIEYDTDGNEKEDTCYYINQDVTVTRFAAVNTAESKVDFKLTASDNENPKCEDVAGQVFEVPALSAGQFIIGGNCRELEIDVEFKGSDNSVVKADTKADSVLGSAAKPYGDAAKAAGSMTYKLLSGCTAVAGTDIVNSKQKCTIKHDCTKAVPDAVTLESALSVDTGTDGCNSKFTYKTEDKVVPSITLADEKCSQLHGTFETDVGKKTFAEASLRIPTYQTDGFVTDNSGSEVTCAVVGAALGDIAIGNTGERSLECTDKAGLKSTCKFTVTVEDKEIPTFEGDTCGKSQGSFDPKKGDTTYKFKVPTVTAKDNSGDAPTVTTKVSKNGADCADCPTEGGKEHDFEAGVYVYTLTAEDAAKNKNYCVYTFTVNFKEDEVAITADKLEKNGEIPLVTSAKTKQPTKKPTQNPTRNPTVYVKDDKFSEGSCKNRCDAKGNQVEHKAGQAIFTCSCNRAVCTQDKEDKTKVACCADMDAECKAPAVQCTKDNCGSRVAAGLADGKDCFCDHNCAAKGDCCNNFDFNKVCCADDQAGSCKGKCGKADAIFSCKDQRNCYCDDACTNNGDCCADYSTECKK